MKCHKLLLFYPRDYRRERGEEIVSILLESGSGRPTLREAANLFCHGMRCRLGRPASRSVVVWAALASVLCGLFAAAFATRAAWETARPLPEKAEVLAVVHTVLPGHEVTADVYRNPDMFVIYGEPLSSKNIGTLLSLDGGEYGLGSTALSLNGPPPVEMTETIRVAQERLRANGWQVAAPLTRNAMDCAGPPCDPTKRGLGRATPWAVWPAAVAAGLFGALAGWLVFGWASRRSQARPWQRALSSVLFGITATVWGIPSAVALTFTVEHHLTEPHLRWHPLWEWLGQPAFSVVFLFGLGAALAALAVALPPTPAAQMVRGSAT